MFFHKEPDNIAATEGKDIKVGDGQPGKERIVGFCATDKNNGRHGLGFDYFVLEKEKGKGFASEGVRMFLKLFWGLESK